MKAYKIWEDTPHFIHKDTTNELNVRWTENIEEAKEVSTFREAVDFFFDHLGFSLNLSIPDALYLTLAKRVENKLQVLNTIVTLNDFLNDIKQDENEMDSTIRT